jgi:hypothetical protein
MSDFPKSFSYPSYRYLKKYLGEMDAMVEMTELAVRSFMAFAEQSGNSERFVEEQSKCHKVTVSLSERMRIRDHLAQTYIVNVFQAMEIFFTRFRGEHIVLFQQEWTGDTNRLDKLTIAQENVFDSTHVGVTMIGNDLIQRYQYYRLVRNWATHDADVEPVKIAAKFHALPPYSPDRAVAFAQLNAPNLPEVLNFDDFLCFTRISKLIAEALTMHATPSVDILVKTTDASHANYLQSRPDRRRNAVQERIRRHYGLDRKTAQYIAEEVCR